MSPGPRSVALGRLEQRGVLDRDRSLGGEDTEGLELVGVEAAAAEHPEHSLELAAEEERIAGVGAQPLLGDPGQAPDAPLAPEVVDERRLAGLRDAPAEEHSERHAVVWPGRSVEDAGARR